MSTKMKTKVLLQLTTFACGPDGKVFLSAINFPGSQHDGSIPTNLVTFIKVKFEGTGFF